uniref:Uncharacterized protein n=1 Tax=Rhizophora mucronata TaxID=61149 RepID=A0A2P2Q2F5_RHIMU
MCINNLFNFTFIYLFIFII